MKSPMGYPHKNSAHYFSSICNSFAGGLRAISADRATYIWSGSFVLALQHYYTYISAFLPQTFIFPLAQPNLTTSGPGGHLEYIQLFFVHFNLMRYVPGDMDKLSVHFVHILMCS